MKKKIYPLTKKIFIILCKEYNRIEKNILSNYIKIKMKKFTDI